MRKTSYILHGCCDRDEFFSDQYPSPSNSHWLPWLQKKMLEAGYGCQTPEMPTPYEGQHGEWKALFDTFPISDETVIVCHSCSCGFILRWLGETGARIKKLVLVAPWLDPQRTRGDFLDFILNPNIASQVDSMAIFYAENEPVDGVKGSVDLILKTYPKATLQTFKKHGHFCFDDMGTTEFPELLKAALA